MATCPACGLTALRLEPEAAGEYEPAWAGWLEVLREDQARGERGRGAQTKRRKRGGKKPEYVPWYRRPSSYWD